MMTLIVFLSLLCSAEDHPHVVLKKLDRAVWEKKSIEAKSELFRLLTEHQDDSVLLKSLILYYGILQDRTRESGDSALSEYGQFVELKVRQQKRDDQTTIVMAITAKSMNPDERFDEIQLVYKNQILLRFFPNSKRDGAPQFQPVAMLTPGLYEAVLKKQNGSMSRIPVVLTKKLPTDEHPLPPIEKSTLRYVWPRFVSSEFSSRHHNRSVLWALFSAKDTVTPIRQDMRSWKDESEVVVDLNAIQLKRGWYELFMDFIEEEQFDNTRVNYEFVSYHPIKK